MPTIYKVDEGEGTRSKSGKRLSGEGGTNETGCVKRETVVLSVTPVLLPGKSHGWRSLVRYSPWGLEESDMTERLHFHFSLSCIGKDPDNWERLKAGGERFKAGGERGDRG